MNIGLLPTMSRTWAMPNKDTFSVRPIGEFVHRYLCRSNCSVDPFARNKDWATHTNDLNPSTSAKHHMDAVEYLDMLYDTGIRCDFAMLDPPYSPRQISECYKELGFSVGMKDTQSAVLYMEIKTALNRILLPGAIVLSFGWNSSGMGQKYGATILEIMLVAHGGAHNDTICLAERMP